MPNSSHYHCVFFILTGLVGLWSCSTPEASLADKKNYTEDDQQYRRRHDVTPEEGEKILRYWSHYVVSKTPNAYRVRIFHPEKKVLTEDKSYSTAALTLLHGTYKGYWDDGSIREKGSYQYGRKHGNWLECEPGKGKCSTGPYLNHKKDGVWTHLDTTGLIESVYTWSDGQRHGKFFRYDSLGHKSNEGLYRADTLVAQLFPQSETSRPYLKACQQSGILDVYGCTEAMLSDKIISSLKYPASARQMGIEGSAVVQWDVMPDGSVRNIRIPQALSDDIEKESLRAAQGIPEWIPAHRDGKPVRYTMTLPINFRL